MTIVVGVATPEGLVLASDSRSTILLESGRHRISSDHAQKTFVVGTVAVATFGAAVVDGETIAGLMDQFIAQQGDELPPDVVGLAEALGSFFDERFMNQVGEWDTDEHGYPLGFLVGGYDDTGVGHLRRVAIPGPVVDEELVPTTKTGGALWSGQGSGAVERLIHGTDWSRLGRTGVELSEEVFEALQGLQYVLIYPSTIQDGVDYAAFLVRTSIDMQRFSDGTVAEPEDAPSCGGQIQILAVERSGPTWVSQLRITGPSPPGWAEEAAPS